MTHDFNEAARRAFIQQKEELVNLALSRQAELDRRLAHRQKEQEERYEHDVVGPKRTEEEVASLRARLTWLETSTLPEAMR